MSHENTSTLVQKMETALLPPARGNSQCALVDALMQDLGGVWSGFCLNDTFNEKEWNMLSEYKWILLQNLNDGLFLIWLALLVGTTVTGIDFLMDFTRYDRSIPVYQTRLKWLRYLMGTLFLLGTILVALPDKEQIALMRGEPVGHPSEVRPFFEKKVIIMPVE